jgi:hypothetical protein
VNGAARTRATGGRGGCIISWRGCARSTRRIRREGAETRKRRRRASREAAERSARGGSRDHEGRAHLGFAQRLDLRLVFRDGRLERLDVDRGRARLEPARDVAQEGVERRQRARLLGFLPIVVVAGTGGDRVGGEPRGEDDLGRGTRRGGGRGVFVRHRSREWRGEGRTALVLAHTKNGIG